MSETIIHSSLLAAEAQVVLDGLVAEFADRYGTDRPGGARAEVDRYPPAAFVPPLGDFLVLLQDGHVVAGGAFMSHDDETVEIKRVWTHPAMRRQGLAHRIMAALEKRAGDLGYTRAYLTTGFRQPEAVALYLKLGFRPLFDLDAAPALYRSLPFEKHIGVKAGQPGCSPLRRPARSFEEATVEVNAIKSEQEARILGRLAQFTPVG
ncbi:GNAT family N-acetyltransferase (plasmid) [Roseomonas gilardii subsp. gilardii]|uniref:GNAT family N-acetyltransferase n=1 Tax=Roseomonas gilardii TaxID=257708 RepID=UPI001FF86B02|nr:GNAT family N-acetyltransferase [Roseomonas gilardii]UPG74720.1 GNAT family N-acetyltransferase [Roseomonas gilardii subsp. gilardii]